MRVAYCVPPKIGGTYNFYRTLSSFVSGQGIDLLSISTGHRECGLADPQFISGRCEQVAPEEIDLSAAAKALVRWVQDNAVDIIIPMNSAPAIAAVPFLPPSVRLLNRCSNTTRHNYEIVAANQDYASAIACSSQRQMTDLRDHWKVPAEKLALIAHGVDVNAFAHDKAQSSNLRIRLCILGRLEHQSKGILHIPGILRQLSLPTDAWQLDIYGSGPDEAALERQLQRWIEQGNVTFHGRISNDEVPSALARHDVFLMPSHFEGFGFALIEAMAAGCVPVASHLRGVTDFIVEQQKTGILCPVGDSAAFARAIEQLARAPMKMRALSEDARRSAFERFSMERFGRNWVELLTHVYEHPSQGKRRTDLQALRVVEKRSPWRFIPAGLKGQLRGGLERLRASRMW